MFTKNATENISLLDEQLRIGKTFDVVKREVVIGGRQSVMYFVDGFIKDDLVQRLLEGFFKITPAEMANIKDLTQFSNQYISYVEVTVEKKLDAIITQVLSGPMAFIIDGFDEVIMLDVRTYPARGPEEPSKEKVLRGSRDGFVETIVFNTALIRRRIRTADLSFEMVSVGSLSKTDVAIGYIDGIASPKDINLIKDKIKEVHVNALTMTDRSLVEAMRKSWFNPFPKVRYTERPDVAAAHLLEGKIVVIIDNSPSVLILPTTIFSFMQDIDDYYVPPLTGNYLRLIRNFILLATVFITPLYLLLTKIALTLPEAFHIFALEEQPVVPLLLQFLLLEVAIDGLKLASLNTPDTLGMSLSVVGALILGDMAISIGWFSPQAVLYMAVVALGSFAQPSIELGYAIKFMRLILLFLTALFSTWGFIGGLVIILIILITNKTITGDSYLYPLVPFNGKELWSLMVRTPIGKDEPSPQKNK
ncbi:MAG TPA: spore germination protein [Firmicutes bacterium]|nr:spore germination protein [Bacillota bacterium]